MLKQRKRDDNDAFDERGILKDGRTLRVLMMDAADLPKVRDADGGPLGQPGFTTRDEAAPLPTNSATLATPCTTNTTQKFEPMEEHRRP